MSRPKHKIHGWLILDKPTGISSAQAVAKVKHLFGCEKLGHGGTLDPLASGILPLALGEATKLFDVISCDEKTYEFTVTWGEERSTDDAEGEVLASTDVIPTREAIEAALPAFIGEIEQIPPIYSAIKVNGKRAYTMARAGEEVTLESRKVEVYRLELLNISGQDKRQSSFLMTCGKGTYVRSIARDLARKLNSLAYVSTLRRTRVGKFTENRSISLEKLESLGHSPALHSAIVPVESVLDDIPAINADSFEVERLRHGQAIKSRGASTAQQTVILHQGKLVALAKTESDLLKPVRVFNH